MLHILEAVLDRFAAGRLSRREAVAAPVAGDSAIECGLGLGAGVNRFCTGVAGHDAARGSQAVAACGLKPRKYAGERKK